MVMDGCFPEGMISMYCLGGRWVLEDAVSILDILHVHCGSWKWLGAVGPSDQFDDLIYRVLGGPPPGPHHWRSLACSRSQECSAISTACRTTAFLPIKKCSTADLSHT